jgi:hypothetical protein
MTIWTIAAVLNPCFPESVSSRGTVAAIVVFIHTNSVVLIPPGKGVFSERGGGALSFEAGARERRAGELLYDESARESEDAR